MVSGWTVNAYVNEHIQWANGSNWAVCSSGSWNDIGINRSIKQGSNRSKRIETYVMLRYINENSIIIIIIIIIIITTIIYYYYCYYYYCYYYYYYILYKNIMCVGLCVFVGKVDGWMNKWRMNEWMNEWMDEWMDEVD